MKYLKKFNTENDRSAYENGESYIEPYVSYVDGGDVHYNKPPETRLIATYNVEDASNPTQLYMYLNQQGAPFKALGADMFSKVEIDETEVSVQDLDTAQGQYQFSVGEHTVKYTLIDPTFTGIEFNGQTDEVTRLGALFAQICPNLVSVKIPNTVITIGNGTFAECTNLTSVTIPNNVTSIGVETFYGCSSLTSIEIPDSVTSIGGGDFSGGAFSGCINLSTITSHIMNAPSVYDGTFDGVKNGGTLYVPIGSSGYETWMNDQGNLGLYNWTKVEQ